MENRDKSWHVAAKDSSALPALGHEIVPTLGMKDIPARDRVTLKSFQSNCTHRPKAGSTRSLMSLDSRWRPMPWMGNSYSPLGAGDLLRATGGKLPQMAMGQNETRVPFWVPIFAPHPDRLSPRRSLLRAKAHLLTKYLALISGDAKGMVSRMFCLASP